MRAPDQKPVRLILNRFPLDPEVLASEHTAQSVFLNGRLCTDSDLRALAALPNATALQIAGLGTTPAALAEVPWLQNLHLDDPTTLDGLERLRQVRKLGVYHFSKIHDLRPIGTLEELRSLLLSTPPGYDASRKCFEVGSLEPLARLGRLEELTMRGVVPLRDRLEPIHNLKRLLRLAITHVYCFTLEDYARLARALPDTTGHCLEPFFAASWAGTCRRCGGGRVVLTGPRPRHARLLCPACQQTRLEQHVAAWNAIAQ